MTLPIEDYELFRLHGQRSIFERWRSVKYQLLHSDEVHSEKFMELHDTMREHYIEIMAHMNLMRQKDGLDSIRVKANQDVRNLVQQKIYLMQNPDDCSM